MYATPEQLKSANHAAADTALTLANIAFAGAERIAALNLNAGRTLLDDAVSNVKALLAVKDLQDLIQVQTALAQPAFDKALAYARDLYEISNESQENFGQVFEAQFAELNKNLSGALDKFARNAPAGSDVAVAAVRSAIAAANSAYDSVTKAARQVAEIAEANVAAAGTTVKAASPSAAKSKKAA